MFETGRDTSFGSKNAIFYLKKFKQEEIVPAEVLKGSNKNIIVNFDEIWLNMFRMGRDISFESKNAVFYLKNLNRKKLYQQKC